MNLGQSMFALAALSLLSYVALNTDKAIIYQNDRIDRGEFGITAVALAQSLVEEAMGKYFDANPETSVPGEITSTGSLTAVGSLGHGSLEKYRNGTNDFNDFDDYNNLFLVYKSDGNNYADTAKTAGSDWETIIPNLKSKYYLKVKVQYVRVSGSNNIPLSDFVATSPTYHKKMTVTVIDPTLKDTLVYPAIMSYWK